ncbi:MAG TPA: C40 family peptidase, partial [Nocardioidaceae bacterium]
MSIAEVTSRIAQIQGQLSQLAPAAAPARADAATFSSALGAAQAGLAGDVTWSANALGPALSTTGPAAVAGTGSAGATADGLAVVEEARKYLGIPYLWGGTDPQQGLDCSGLVQLVYKQFGIDLPRVSYQQATAGRPVASMAEARPGDILAFDSPVDHVAIYIGDGKMIEAPRTGL